MIAAMPSGATALLQAVVVGVLASGLVFSAFAARVERRPGPIFAYGLMTAMLLASVPFAMIYGDAEDLETYAFAFTAHSLITRGVYFAWIFYLQALVGFRMRVAPLLMYAFEIIRTLFTVAYLDTPYFLELQSIERVPWLFGDVVTVAVSEPTNLHFLLVLSPIFHTIYTASVLLTLARQGQRKIALTLALPFFLVFCLVLHDNLSDWLGLSRPYLSELGFPIVVFALAASLMEWIVAGQRARETVAVQEAQLAQILDSISDGVIACDPDHQIIRMNPVAVALARGHESDDRAPFHSLFHITEAKTHAPVSIEDLIDDPRDLRVETERGPRLVSAAAARIHGRERKPALGCVVVMRDITDRARHEALSRRNEKMVALGELAGGVAHDFNNYLSAIGASNQLIEKKGDDPTLRGRMTSRVADAVAQAASLTRKLLEFSRDNGEQSIHERVSVHALILSAKELIRSMLGSRISVELALEAEHDVVLGDSHALQSALLNLAKNAGDAIEANGILRIATSNTTLEGGTPAIAVAIQDSGEGIPPEFIERIFDPFFTSKAEGAGTGLGLASVHRTVERHSGIVEVESTLGEGATFTFTLPLEPTLAASLPPPPEPPRSFA